MKPRILVVGSINMDLTVYGVPHLPDFGEVVLCSECAYAPGGKGANAALTLHKMGASSALCGKLGADENGEGMLASLTAGGVDTRYVTREAERSTGLVIFVTEADGRNHGYGMLGANLSLTEADVRTALDAERWDRVLMQLEIPLEVVYSTYEMAARRGIPVMLDAGPAMPIPLERFKGIDIISPNEPETKALTGIDVIDDEDALRAAKALYAAAQPRLVLLKMGSRGVALYDGASFTVMPAFQVDAIDSTAAGDTFNAALCVRLACGESTEMAVRYAQAAAGISVTRRGAIASIPTMAEVETFLARHA